MATIDTSWHPVAVPDTGGSAFLSYSSALRDSANKLLENVVSQRQKDRELAQAELRDKLANTLAVAKLEQDARQNDIINALNEKKFAEAIRDSDENRKLKKRELEIEAMKATAQAEKNRLIEAKMGLGGGSSAFGKLPSWVTDKNQSLPFGVDDKASTFFFSSKFYRDALANPNKYNIDRERMTKALSGYTKDQWNMLKGLITSYENLGWLDSTQKNEMLIAAINTINNGYNQALLKNLYDNGQIKEILNNQELKAVAQRYIPELFLMANLKLGQTPSTSTTTSSATDSTERDAFATETN